MQVEERDNQVGICRVDLESGWSAESQTAAPARPCRDNGDFWKRDGLE